MRFDRIELTNYRSFGPGTTVVEFPAHENIVALSVPTMLESRIC